MNRFSGGTIQWKAAHAEFGGGVLLALGLATPLGAAILLSVMLVAIVSVHLKQGFFAMKGGYEYPMVLGLSALSLAFTGPGPLSVDALLSFDLGGAGWGLAALSVGMAGGAIQLASRRAGAAPPMEAQPQSA